MCQGRRQVNIGCQLFTLQETAAQSRALATQFSQRGDQAERGINEHGRRIFHIMPSECTH